MITLRPGLKPEAPSLSLLPQQSQNSSRVSNETGEKDVLSVAVDSDPNAIYLNLSLPEFTPTQNVTEMDAIGFRVQFVSLDNYTVANRTWSHAEFADFVYRSDGVPYVLRNLTWGRIYLLRASTKNVAGFSDFSEPPLEVNLSSFKLGQTSGSVCMPVASPCASLISLVVLCSTLVHQLSTTFVGADFVKRLPVIY